MGILFGRLNVFPCVRLMPLTTLYSRSRGRLFVSKPANSAENLMADMCAVMCLCEWVGDRCVANSMRVF